MKRICITGGNGLLGTKLARVLKGVGDVISIDRHAKNRTESTHVEYVQGDITDEERIGNIIVSGRCDMIIHTAAMTDVDGCEESPEKAYEVNVCGTENVAKAADAVGARLVHLSTDYIFNGADGPYREEDNPDPVSVYGRTKLESEAVVRKVCRNHLVVRTMVLYGYAPHLRKNFVTWLIEKLAHKEPVRIVTDQYGTATPAEELAGAIGALLEQNLRGTYNAAGREVLNRYEFSQIIASVFGLDSSLISATTSKEFKQKAARPKKSGLVCDKLERDTGYRFSPLRKALARMKDEMDWQHYSPHSNDGDRDRKQG